MVPDRQKVWTDGRNGRTDDAKTIFLRLRRGIKSGHFSKKRVQKRNTIESPLKTRKFTSFWNVFSWPSPQRIS